MKKNTPRMLYGITGALGVLVLAQAGILLAGSFPQSSLDKERPLEGWVQEMIERCADSSYRPTCYEEKVPELMEVLSMEEVFEVTRRIQAQDGGFPYCHVLGHEVSAREVRKDPAKWKDVVTRCPSGICSNGCIHGGFQERFRAESVSDEELEPIKEELMDLCEPRGGWSPTGLEQGSCYHALGHLTMYITEADIPKAVETCDEITGANGHPGEMTHLCYDGVFMQIFQPLEPEDFDLIEGKVPEKGEILSYCAEFTGAYPERVESACLSESWPLFWDEVQTPEGLVGFCSMTQEKLRSRCFNAMFYVMSVQLGLDVERITEYCSGLPTEVRGQCFANGASRMIEVDYRNASKAVQLCTRAQSFEEGTKCFSEILFYSTYNYHPGSEEFYRLCEQLPAPWNEQCLERAPS